MDKQAFKQRMQNLKSYRENNPGKGYWDWRNSLPDNLKYTDDTEYDMQAAYESGVDAEYVEEDRSYHLPTRDPKTGYIFKKSTHPTFWKGLAEDAKLGYDAYFLGDKVYTKSKGEGPIEAFEDGGVSDNLVGSYSNHTGTPTMYVPVTKQYEATPEGFGEIVNVHTPEVTITPQSNISLVEAVDKGRRDAAPYVGAIVAGATLPAMSSTNMLGKAIDLANIVLDPTNPANYVKIPNIRLGRWSAKFPEYGNQNKAFRQVNVDAVDDYINTGVVGPESKAHNAMRSAQNANKNSGGGSKHLLTLLTKHFDTHVMFNKTKPFYGKDSKYPRVLVGDLRNPRINWKKVNHKGHKNIVEPVDPSAGNFTVPIEEFDIWRKAKIGWLRDQKANRFAEGGQTGDPEKERFYQATGRSSSGRPLEEGLKPVFSIEDAANMTPIGDAISARDTYNAVKNRDWLSAGLAALTVLPFVPSGLRNVKAAARYIPTVNRTEQSLINQALGNISKKRDYLSDIANSRNRVLEDINTIPYRNRAEQADKIFGTNYSETYDLLDDLYQHRYFDLPEVQPKDMVASGRLQAKPFAEERFNKTGVGAEPNEFDLWVNTGMYRDPMQLANHEMNHYTDYIISRNANTTINNNMLKQLENSLKQTDATSYYRKGTEQKAYMNQLRTMLKQNGDVQNLDEPVSSTLLKKYLDKMSDSDPIKKKNRGKFNALKKRTGKTTEELTHSKNPLTRKRAIFAQNAKKWKHKGRKKK